MSRSKNFLPMTLVLSLAACAGSSVAGAVDEGTGDCMMAVIAKDFVAGQRVCVAACDAGKPEGCAGLATFYERGVGVSPDQDRAIELRTRACTLGDSQSCEAANITSQDVVIPAKARDCEGVSDTDVGAAAVCSEAGFAYLDGRGVPVDRPRAEKLLKKACRLGEMKACDAFGFDAAKP